MNKLKRIEENSIKSYDTKTSSYEAIVNQAEAGRFSLTLFACIQVIAGAEFIEVFQNAKQNIAITRLLGKLSIYAINLTGTDEPLQVELERSEVEHMKTLLEARMRHCEIERDQQSSNFNADTYISQKLLLLDIREWLMVYSVKLVRKHDEELVAN
jgi:hypothetical protein